MSDSTTLRLTLKGSEEAREDRWAVKSLEFGFVVYGATREEANHAFGEAVTALLNSFGGDEPSLRQYLEDKGVQYQFEQAAAESYFQRHVEVPIGTPV